MKYLVIALVVNNERESVTVLHSEEIDLNSIPYPHMLTRVRLCCLDVLARWNENPMPGFFADRLILIGDDAPHKRRATFEISVLSFNKAYSDVQAIIVRSAVEILMDAFFIAEVEERNQ